MRKTMACAAALTMVGFVVQAEEAKGQLEVIQIQVGQHGIVDPNKTEIPIPDFPWGDQFVVEVLWDEHAEGLVLTLSDFRLVTYDPAAEWRRGEQVWPWDPDFEVQILDERDNAVSAISLSFADAERTESGMVTRKALTLERTGSGGEPETPQLVLFKQTLSKVIFEIDPPWVGKPPVG